MPAPKRRVVIPAHDIAATVGIVCRSPGIPADLSRFGNAAAETADCRQSGILFGDGCVNFLQQRASAAGIPPGPVVEDPVPDNVTPLRVAAQNRIDVAEDDGLGVDLRVFVGTAVRIVRIALRRRRDGVRAMTLPEKEYSRYPGVDDRDAVRLQRLLQVASGRRRAAIENRSVNPLVCRGCGALWRVDA